MDDKEPQIFMPFCIVAAFGDGQRIRFPGIDKDHCYDLMLSACEQHGDVTWYDYVTDEFYENGVYYKLTPQPPTVNVVDYTGYNGPLDENGLPVGLAEQIAQAAAEEGRDPSEPQIIIKRNAPKDKEGLDKNTKK